MAEQQSGTFWIWALAGLRVRTNRHLPRCRQVAGRRWDVRVEFHASPDEIERALAGDAAGAGWHRSPPGARGWIRGDGRLARVEAPAAPAGDPAALARRVLPYAAALQGRMMLHAAAVVAGDGVHAFIGPSGTGKSTLAAELERQGREVVADDLLLCVERRGRIVASIRRQGVARGQPLAGVYFLERAADRAQPRCTALSRGECFRRLLRHGFGELEVPAVWALQFGHCQRIAEHSRAFALELPDALDQLGDSAGMLIREQLGRRSGAAG